MITPEPTMLKWDSETLSRFWGYHSQFSESYFSYQKGRALVEYVRPRLSDSSVVLDYGCGPGHLLPHLLDAGLTAQGADIARETIGRAVNVADRKGFLGFATISELLAERRKFDAVFLLEVVEHLDDDSLSTTLSNAKALLRPDGALIVTTPNEERLADNMVYCPVSNVVFHRWQHIRSWSQSTLEQCIASHGFRDVNATALTFEAPKPLHISSLRYRLSTLVNRFRKPQSLILFARA